MTVLDALAILELQPWSAQLNEKNEVDIDKETQQQTLCAIFSVIRESVKDLLRKQSRGYSY